MQFKATARMRCSFQACAGGKKNIMESNNNHLMQALSRYAALLFCRADALFQVNDQGVIKFCTGPT